MTENRPALVDLTNHPKKRVISSILDDLVHKSEDKSGKAIAHEDSSVKFSKRLCLVVDDLVKENDRPIDTNEGSCSDDKESGESHDTTVEISSDDGKALKESCKIYFEPGDRDGAQELNATANANQMDVTGGEGFALTGLSCNTKSLNAVVPNCQNLRSFEMSRCSNVNKEVYLDQNMGDDLFKSCSCSFCVKAAYIWSDLHYQDIKSRLSALKKSQKEASNLIQRNVKEMPKDCHGSVNSVASAKLESKLMGQWRSLFLSMGDILAHESNHLQNSFVTMKNLREDCKIDLERAMKTPQRNT